MKLSQKEILKAVRGKLIVATTGEKITGVSTDTRTVKRGDLFIPLKGRNYDAHSFLEEAFKKGAVGALVEKKSLSFNHHRFFIIQVPSTLRALGDLATYWRQQFKIPVVAVTGSNGKTTTKEMIFQILKQKYRTLKTEGNLNNLIGLPQTLFRLSGRDQAAVVEMGMNAPGEIDRLAEIASPQAGVITNIGHAHLEGLGSLRAVAKAKGELLKRLPSNGTAILNADDGETKFLKKLCHSRQVNFGLRKATYQAFQVRLKGLRGCSTRGMEFLLKKTKKTERFEIPLVSVTAVSNALAAIAVGDLLSVSWPQMKKGLKNFRPPPNRMQIKKIRNLLVLDDTYNANPDSMKAALKTLHSLTVKGRRKVAILGEMLELGRYENKGHREVGQEAAVSGLDLLVTIGRRAAGIAAGARQERFEKIRTFGNFEKAKRSLPSLLRPNDVILLKGSRGARMERFLELFTKGGLA
ncbi:MAG: UDP-N-acetylmuramoyl-tripeptide--D-alanyl-D-alanine ligase [Deltaproteobacteria bacterium]|nr:UDP-N-acetylmuramoyl-tripeptide--D-alanyl-D-alanine ligase [Deltaproteobacteria bacterium]